MAGDLRVAFPVVRRHHRPGGHVGLRQVLLKRPGLRGQRVAARRGRHLQLGLRQPDHPGRQPRARRPAGDGEPVQHVPRPHQIGAGHHGGRARQVLPDRQAELRPRRGGRRLPGRRGRAAIARSSASRTSTSSPTRRTTGRASHDLCNPLEQLGDRGRRRARPGTGRRTTRRSGQPIPQRGADGVFLGGIIDHNGGKLIKDLRAVLARTPDHYRPGRLHPGPVRS